MTSAEPIARTLREGFAAPPPDSRVMMRWWWFGPFVEETELARELEAMAAAGIGGVEVCSTYPLSTSETDRAAGGFLSERFLSRLRFAAETASRLGLRFDVTIGSGWSFGGPHNLLTGLLNDSPVVVTAGGGRLRSTPADWFRGGVVGGMDSPVQDGLSEVVLPRWGRVVAGEGMVAWQLVGPDGRVVGPVAVFLREVTARGQRSGSVRSYAFALLRWWRWLQVVEVAWDRVTSDEVRDFVLWLGRARKAPVAERTVSRATAGTVNVVTGKRYLGEGYEPRTVRHSNAVLRAFYEYWIESGGGPLVNPVPLGRGRADGRANAHHDPLQPLRAEGRLRYNPKIAKRRPRAIGDQAWAALFAALGSNRDRAIATLAVSNGARAGELLGIRGVDLDWGAQLVRVTRKGSRAEQWLPAGPEAFVWLRLYLAELAGTGDSPSAQQPLWWTLLRRDHGAGLARQPLTYDALRAVLRRVNALLGANYSMHDLRHTAALRMASDERLSMRDVQTILGHAHLSTTADVYLVEDDAAVLGRVHRHLSERRVPPLTPPPAAAGYDAGDLSILFGEKQ